jgi:hypothetical protein
MAQWQRGRSEGAVNTSSHDLPRLAWHGGSGGVWRSCGMVRVVECWGKTAYGLGMVRRCSWDVRRMYGGCTGGGCDGRIPHLYIPRTSPADPAPVFVKAVLSGGAGSIITISAGGGGQSWASPVTVHLIRTVLGWAVDGRPTAATHLRVTEDRDWHQKGEGRSIGAATERTGQNERESRMDILVRPSAPDANRSAVRVGQECPTYLETGTRQDVGWASTPARGRLSGQPSSPDRGLLHGGLGRSGGLGACFCAKC